MLRHDITWWWRTGGGAFTKSMHMTKLSVDNSFLDDDCSNMEENRDCSNLKASWNLRESCSRIPVLEKNMKCSCTWWHPLNFLFFFKKKHIFRQSCSCAAIWAYLIFLGRCKIGTSGLHFLFFTCTYLIKLLPNIVVNMLTGTVSIKSYFFLTDNWWI